MRKKVPKAGEAGRKRIVVVDDHPVVRHGIAQLLGQEKDLEVCGEAENAVQALEVIAKTRPDAVIVDITLKGTNGIELIKILRKLNPRLILLVVSMHDEIFYAERSLKAGARGYLMKQEAAGKVILALRKVLKGEVYLSEQMSSRVLNTMVGGGPESRGLAVEALSDRELEVFHLIGQGLTTKQIAQDLNLSVKTVEAHREHIKSKLDLKSGPRLMKYAMQWAQAQ